MQQKHDELQLKLFNKSSLFKTIETACEASDKLVVKEQSSSKYDLDSEQGQQQCKNYLQEIEMLHTILGLDTGNREYRDKFSKAYKVLYNDDGLCYLVEILDSAQEGFPFLWVNCEKYVFSRDVLDSGNSLFSHFQKLTAYLHRLR